VIWNKYPARPVRNCSTSLPILDDIHLKIQAAHFLKGCADCAVHFQQKIKATRGAVDATTRIIDYHGPSLLYFKPLFAHCAQDLRVLE